MNQDDLRSQLKELLQMLDALLEEVATIEKIAGEASARRKAGLLTRIEVLRERIKQTELEILLSETRWERRQEEFTHQKRMHWWSRSIASIGVAGALWIGYRETSHPHDPPPPPPYSQAEHGKTAPHNPDGHEESHEAAPKDGQPKPANTNGSANLNL